MKERLQKLIARAGLASRREAERMIEEGRVRVNGQLVDQQGFLADPEEDHIKVDGKLLKLNNEYVYFLLNKPKGVVTTVNDPEERPTVMELMAPVKIRLFPVGRLDLNTEGALLMTNDGDLANKLLKPGSKCPKTYLVKVAGIPDEKDLWKLRRGITIDGLRYSKCTIDIIKSGKNTWLTVVLTEGKNHQIKNMFQAVGHPVSKLRRIGFAFLSLKGLDPGQFRELNEVEVERLKRGDVDPLTPISPLRTLKKIGVDVPKEPEPAPSDRSTYPRRRPGQRSAKRPGARPGNRSSSRPGSRPEERDRRSSSTKGPRRGPSSGYSRDSENRQDDQRRSQRDSGSGPYRKSTNRGRPGDSDRREDGRRPNRQDSGRPAQSNRRGSGGKGGWSKSRPGSGRPAGSKNGPSGRGGKRGR